VGIGAALFSGYYSLSETILFSPDQVFLATPTLIKVFDRKPKTSRDIKTPFLAGNYDDVLTFSSPA
jgi:hypothetical protein